MHVRIKKTDDFTGVKAGEVYEACRYWLAPDGKVTLLARVPDGYDPCCNEYLDNVEVLPEWHGHV